MVDKEIDNGEDAEAKEILQKLRSQIGETRRTELINIAALSLVLIGFVFALFNTITDQRSVAELDQKLALLKDNFKQLQEQYSARLASSEKAGGVCKENDGFGWLETGIQADWGARDIAFTRGILPRFSVGSLELCNKNRIGSIAVCWQDRPSGFPAGVPSDFQGISRSWCTYKDDSIRLNTPPDGRAPPGIVFVCSKTSASQ